MSGGGRFDVLRQTQVVERALAGGRLLTAVTVDATDEERLALETALKLLPPEQREVLYLKVFEGHTFHDDTG